MKRYFSLILALLMGVFGFGFSDKPVESRAALLSAQPVIAELTVAAAPAPANILKTSILPSNEAPGIQISEQTEKSETETKTKQDAIAEKATQKPELPVNEKGYLWPADLNAEIIAGYPSYSDGSAHWGVDIGLYNEDGCNISEGTSIYATRDGVVVTACNDGKWNTGFGNYCIIDHGDGVQTLYAHSRDILVEEGDIVGQGQIIGIVGDTGNTTAPHLHFEVRVEGGRNGYKRVNPLKFISES